jgi:hypothetical protein
MFATAMAVSAGPIFAEGEGYPDWRMKSPVRKNGTWAADSAGA